MEYSVQLTVKFPAHLQSLANKNIISQVLIRSVARLDQVAEVLTSSLHYKAYRYGEYGVHSQIKAIENTHLCLVCSF